MHNSQIEKFIAVAESGSFSKAGEKLFISATAVMKQINALEDRLNIKLFNRTNHGLELTEAGKILLQDAKYMVEYSARAIEKAKDVDRQGRQQVIRIGTSIMTPAKFLLDVWNNFQEFSPNLKIELIPFDNNPTNSVEILKNLGKHIDIVGGLYDEEFLIERNCSATHLYDKVLLFAIPVANHLSGNSIITLTDLQNQKVMIIRKGWNKYIDKLRVELERVGAIIEDFSMFNISAFNKAVNENIPIVTIAGWEDVHPLLKIVPTDLQYKVPFGILHSPTPSKQVKDFLTLLKKFTKQ